MFDDLSIVIPYRETGDPIRQAIFQWTLKRYEAITPGAEIIIGEMTDPSFPYFCRSQAINNGVKKTTRPWLLIADTDAVAFPGAIRATIEKLTTDQNYGWGLPYLWYYELSHESSIHLMSLGHDFNDRYQGFTLSESQLPPYGEPTSQSTSSLAILTVDNFWESGGFDERFIGWAPEDQAWADAISTLCGPYYRYAEVDLYHLWHPVARGTTRDNPYYQESDRLWTEYKSAAGNPEAMRRLVSGNEISGS